MSARRSLPAREVKRVPCSHHWLPEELALALRSRSPQLALSPGASAQDSHGRRGTGRAPSESKLASRSAIRSSISADLLLLAIPRLGSPHRAAPAPGRGARLSVGLNRA
jgi:hypothetical protein